MVGVAVANEQLSLPRALRTGLGMGRRHLGLHYRFSLRVLLHALFSVLTVGILWLLYDAHRITLAYWQLIREE